MKFIELKKSLREKINNNYLLFGDDDFLLNKSYELILEQANIQQSELNLVVFNENIINFENVVKSLNTMPFMSEYKVVYVDISLADSYIGIEFLQEYLKNPNPASIIIMNVKNKNSDFKRYNLIVESVDCNKVSESVINGFVNMELKKFNKTIMPSAMKKLNEYCIYNLSYVVTELVKLINYIGQRNEITTDDVDQVVIKNIEYQIFDLTENLAQKKADKVFELLNEMKLKKEFDKNLLSLIITHFRRMLHVSLSKQSKQELSTQLGVKEYAITVLQKQHVKFGQRKLKAIFDYGVDLDFKVKSGTVNYDSAMHLLILKILNI